MDTLCINKNNKTKITNDNKQAFDQPHINCFDEIKLREKNKIQTSFVSNSLVRSDFID
jgi:hypothetical protein